MKFQILQENLKQGLFVVGHTAGKNQNLPILHNIHIEAKDGNIKLTSTNLEIGVTCILRGKVEVEGAYTVDAKIFYDYISVLPNKKIDIELVGDQLQIVTEQHQTKINGQSAEEYPLIPQVERKNGFLVDLQKFKEALSQVVFAVASSDMRLELMGVLLVPDDGGIVMVATDSYRLAEKRVQVKRLGDDFEKAVVPAKTMQEVLRIIGGAKSTVGEIEVYVNENQILFTYDSIEVVSRIIEGQYPDYKQIIPTQTKTSAKVAVNEMVKAVKAASLFSKSGVNDVNLDLPAEKNQLVVSAVSGQAGENISKLTVEMQGDDNGVVVNYRYLIDGLNNMNADEVNINIVDGNTPVVFRPDGRDDYLYLIMPIRQ